MGSWIAVEASWIVTPNINPNDATFTPTRKPAVRWELWMRSINKPAAAINIKEGRKIPAVATIAPGTPPNKYPMKVAVVKTGPGVI